MLRASILRKAPGDFHPVSHRNVVDVVPERGKLQPFIPSCCLSYPFHRIWQVVRAHNCRSFPDAAPGTCFVETDFLWSGPFPPHSPPAGLAPAFVRLLLRYIWACPTPRFRSSLSCSLGIHSANLGAIHQGRSRGLPVPVRKASVHAQGLRPRGAITSLAISICYVSPSVHVDAVGTPKYTLFRGSIPGLHVPLPTLRAPPCGCARMARGQCDSLSLHCMKLDSG
jgi:hypothetical protein